ncbi:MAG: hypothetical protein U0525_03300 [Patescibacteria group bacterium]
MKEFAPDTVLRAINIAEKRKYPYHNFTGLDGQQYGYYVLPQSLKPEVTMFGSAVTGIEQYGTFWGIFGVADTVPEQYRTPWMQYEQEAFREYHKRAQAEEHTPLSEDDTVELVINPFLAAEAAVLDRMPHDDQREYRKLRLDYFQ